MQNWRKNLHIDLRTHLSLEETKYMRKVDHGSLDIQFAFSRGGTSETLSQYPGRMTVGDGRWHGLTTGCWILCYGPWNGLWRAEGPPFQNFFIYQDRSLKFSAHICSKMICVYVGQLFNCPWNGPYGGPKGEGSPISIIQGSGNGWLQVKTGSNGCGRVLTGENVVVTGNNRWWRGTTGDNEWQRVTTGDDGVQVEHFYIFFYFFFTRQSRVYQLVYL